MTFLLSLWAYYMNNKTQCSQWLASDCNYVSEEALICLALVVAHLSNPKLRNEGEQMQS